MLFFKVMALRAQQLSVLLLSCLGVVLAAAAPQPTATKVFYVKPTESTTCPEPCHTLDEYVRNTSRYFVSNTVFNFLSGEHNLTQPWRVSGVTNLALVGISGHVNITHFWAQWFNTSSGSIQFTTVTNFTLEGLAFVSSGDLSTVTLTDVLNAKLMNCEFIGLRLMAMNIIGYSSITNVHFECFSPMEVIYLDNSTLPLLGHTQLNIMECLVCSPNFVRYREVNSIHIELLQSTYTISLHLVSSVMGVDLHVESNMSNCVYITDIYAPGGLKSTATDVSKTSMHISNCIIDGFQFTFLKLTIEDALVHPPQYEYWYLDMNGEGLVARHVHSSVLRNVTFAYVSSYSTAYYPTGLLSPVTFELDNANDLSFIDCKFHGFGGKNVDGDPWQTVVMLYNSNGINFKNCEFKNNTATAISAFDSNFNLSGYNVFSNNTAYHGGAMAFYGSSYVVLANGSHTHFVNNSAITVGGAIFVDYCVDFTACFLKLDVVFDYSCNYSITGTSFTFKNNTAKYGGSILYGASLDTCTFSARVCNIDSDFVSSIFQVDQHQENSSDLSAISSKPLRACVCEEGRPSCTKIFNSYTLYPGQTIEIQAVVVGDRFGTVDGSVYAQVLPPDSPEVVTELGDLQHSQGVEHQRCSNLFYTILSNNSTATLVLTASSVSISQYPDRNTLSTIQHEITNYQATGEIGFNLQRFPVYINITLRPCPLGFILSGEKPQCNCAPHLLDNHMSCNITTQTIQRHGTQWVSSSHKDELIVNKYCPYHYCKSEVINVQLGHPDIQCAFNRSGTLCGGCQSGLSLALGSAQCLSCSNKYLALLIPFALAGIALVFFFKLLDLTVAKGTLNGLIFYANIFRANQATWVPEHSSKWTVFIAWLNLDLGIETCFFDGMDGYWKTWLQFVFPFYIWAIAIMIILLSRRFTPLAKIFGNNSVPVLATLFLLSYPKLLRTIISVFHASTLEYGIAKSVTVWSYDGNVSYLGLKHVLLFVAALLVALLLWLPYTVVLTFAQCFHKIPNQRVNRLLLKFKPFLDAYFGPLNDSHRYWVGLLLLVRGLLFLTFAVTPTSDSVVDLLVVLVVVICLLMYLGFVSPVYKNRFLSLLESSFFVNLAILAGGTLYVRASRGNQTALAVTSVSVAYVQFLVILLAHTISRGAEYLKIHVHKYEPVPQAPEEVPYDRADDRDGNEDENDEEPVTNDIVANRERVPVSTIANHVV